MSIQGIYSIDAATIPNQVSKVNSISSPKGISEANSVEQTSTINSSQIQKNSRFASAYKSVGMGNFVNFTA